jgi:predicted ribosome quality control (RQC) complex YloA/Tae2 family protein
MGVQRGGRALLNLSAAHIAELCNELRPIVRGGRVRSVLALPPADLVLVLERDSPADLVRVRLSADPDAPRVHLQHARVDPHGGPIGPFFRRLAAELVGAQVADVAPVRGDRIVLVELRESPAGARRALLAELVGRHSNLVLLGPNDEIVDVLVPSAKDRADARLQIGRPWTPPPGAPRALRDSSDSVSDALPAPPGPPPGARGVQAPLAWIVECALGEQAGEARRARELKKLHERIARKLSRARGLVAGLEKRLEASAQHEELRRDGELLKAHLHLLRRGLREIELPDAFREDAPPRRIALDPKRSPQENLTHVFERAKKLERARALVEGELEIARTRVRGLERLEERSRADGSDPSELDAEAVEQGLLDPPQEADARKRKESAPRLPYRAFRGVNGSEIRVGRSARDNDDLTFHHARGNDAWLHTSDAPGSHVVICLAGAPDPDPEDLIDAAHLAVHFSPLRDRSRASVHVARRKDVHKPRGAKAGLVTLSGGRILDLRLQPERLARLLRSRRGEEPDDECR